MVRPTSLDRDREQEQDRLRTAGEPIRCKEFEKDCEAKRTGRSPLRAAQVAEQPDQHLSKLHSAWHHLQRRRGRRSPFELILRALPTELQLEVLQYVVPPVLGALQAHWCVLHPLVQNLWRTHEMHLFKRIVDAQFWLESRVFPFRDKKDSLAPSLWTSPDGFPWALYDPPQYLCTLHRIKSLTQLATSAVQIAMPGMRMTDMIYESLLYCWKILRFCAGDPLHGIWAWFAKQPKHVQVGVDNFFDNMVGEFLLIDPVRWPVECACMHMRQLPRRRNRIADDRCLYRVPPRMECEMDSLGVTDLVTKQTLLCSVGRLLNFLWNEGANLDNQQVQLALSWFDMGQSETFWDCMEGVRNHRCAHLPFAPLVMKVKDEDAYDVWVHGEKGDGTVELRCRNWREDICRMLETAVSLPEGEALDLSWFEEEEGLGRLPSFVVDRIKFWEYRWWRDGLGLERLFSTDS